MLDHTEVRELTVEKALEYQDQIAYLYAQLTPTQNFNGVTESDIHHAFINPNYHLFVAVIGRGVVGMGSVFLQRNLKKWIAEIHDIVVDELFREMGIGHRLIESLMGGVQQAANELDEEITLSLTSRPGREEANRLYIKNGFALVSRSSCKRGTNLYKKIIAPC